MTASSWDGWAKMHVNPFVAMRFYFIPAACDILVKGFLISSLPMHISGLFYVATLPYVLHTLVNVAVAYIFFRYGPQIVFHRMFMPSILIALVPSLPVLYLGYIGPQHTVPWNNRLKFLVVSFMNFFAGHLAAAAGGLPGEHPVEPRTSIVKPVCRAIIQTFKVTDSLTDLSLIVELVAEVCLCIARLLHFVADHSAASWQYHRECHDWTY